MNINAGVRLLQLLPTRHDSALTINEILERWDKSGGPAVEKRTIQRYMKDLSESDSSEGSPLVEKAPRGKELAYYLKPTQVANWFMTEEAALDLQLSRDFLGRMHGAGLEAKGGSSGERLVDMAQKLVEASPQTQRIRQRIHIAQDGIGRLPASINKDVLKAALEAIGQDKQLKFMHSYRGARATACLVSPLGLVAKDGTVYLVGARGLSDSPKTYGLHRVSEAEVHHKSAQHRPDFDLQRYVHESHEFSHVLQDEESPVALKLLVAPETIYHFNERPFSVNQKVRPPTKEQPWFEVTATVPNTILLVPFLLSMGHWIEVVGPKSVRDEMRKRARGIWEHYTGDEAAQQP